MVSSKKLSQAYFDKLDTLGLNWQIHGTWAVTMMTRAFPKQLYALISNNYISHIDMLTTPIKTSLTYDTQPNPAS